MEMGLVDVYDFYQLTVSKVSILVIVVEMGLVGEPLVIAGIIDY